MSENTEECVLMKCAHCGYEESVPAWILDELNGFDTTGPCQMCCPECDHTMFIKDSK